MSEYNRYIALAGVIVIGFVVQAMLLALYAVPAPYKTAVAFTKAYYKLDTSMEGYMCEDSRFEADVNSLDIELIRDTLKKLAQRNSQLERDHNELRLLTIAILDGLSAGGQFEQTQDGKYAVSVDEERYMKS